VFYNLFYKNQLNWSNFKRDKRTYRSWLLGIEWEWIGLRPVWRRWLWILKVCLAFFTG